MDSADNQIRATWNSSYEYKNCNDKLLFLLNDLKWDTGLKNVIDTYTGQVFMTNSAPVIWQTMQSEPYNGQEVQLPESMVRSICSIISENTY